MAEKKPREAWEMRFLADWLPRRFPRAQRVMLNVRLGELPREAGGRALTWPERRAMGVKNRFADALVLDGGTLWPSAGLQRQQRVRQGAQHHGVERDRRSDAQRLGQPR